MIRSCVVHFDDSKWNAATIGDYKVQKEKERNERRIKNAEREKNMRARAGLGKRDDTLGVKEESEEHEHVSEAALERHGQLSFITPFLFLLRDGVVHGLTSRILQAAQWRLTDETIDMLLRTLGRPSNELTVKCDYLELFNVLVSGEVPQPLTVQANFLAECFLKCTNLDSLQWPSLDDLITSGNCDRAKHPMLLDLRIRGQLLKISCHVVSSGRVEMKPPSELARGKVGEGKGNLSSISHTSLANEYVLYIALSEEGDSLLTACSMLSHCSRYVESSMYKQQSLQASDDNDITSVEHLLKSELDTTALEGIRRKQSHDQMDTLMIDTLFFACDFLTQVCNKRLELQSVIKEKCASFFSPCLLYWHPLNPHGTPASSTWGLPCEFPI